MSYIKLFVIIVRVCKVMYDIKICVPFWNNHSRP